MRLLSLDAEPLYGDSKDMLSTFGSDVSCFDFDLVLWDPASSQPSYGHYENYQNLPSLSDYASAQIKADVQRRRSEFSDFVKAGRTLVVTVRPPQECYVATGEIRTSGTGRNAQRTRMVDKFDLTRALPVDDPGFLRASGDRIEPVGEGPLQSFIKKHSDDLRYSAIMTSPPGIPLAVVAGTDRVVASVVNLKDGGQIVFLPSHNFEAEWDEKLDRDVWPKKAQAFQGDLIEAIASLDTTSEISRPEWADRFATAKVRDLRDGVVKQSAVVEQARAKLSKLQSDADAAELRDQLFLGTGRNLELRVKEVLELLGCTVTEPAPGRDDWRVVMSGKPVVVEIKGVTKSAAEKHAAQLEKWVAGAFEETGTSPKGLLVVNTWREVPLDERVEDDFPKQMLPYSEGRQHALVTGLELFSIAEDVARDPSKAKFWRDQILKTSGRLKNVPDWRTYISDNQGDSTADDPKSSTESA